VLRLERVLHPRLFRLLLNQARPHVCDDDGQLPADYGSITLRTDLRDGAEREIFLHTYDPPLLALVQRLCQPGWHVVDIGANMGIVATKAANAVGSAGVVLAVEPNPRLAERLRRAAAGNLLSNLHVLEVAVAGQSGVVDFFVSSAHTYSSLRRDFLPDYPLEGVIKVNVVTLEQIFAQSCLSGRIDLLKIDAEGVDYDILLQAEGQIRRAPPQAIIIESSAQDFSAVFHAYRALGYRVFTISKTNKRDLQPIDSPKIPRSYNILLLHEQAQGM
jgi:FkbM family methyltransferase